MKKNGRKRIHRNLESFLYKEERIPRFDESIHKRQEYVLHRKGMHSLPFHVIVECILLSSKPFLIRVESVLNRPSIIRIVPFSFSFGMVKKAFHQNKITFYGIPCKRSSRTVSSNLRSRFSQPKNHS
jgi:hypothetical protein